MSWVSIREYTQQSGLASSTVRRKIQEGRVYARKFGRNWYVHSEDNPPEVQLAGMAGARLAIPSSTPEAGLPGVIEFSSKALHHYLMLSEKLIAEKDLRIAERDERIAHGERALEAREQEIDELEGYVRILERELKKREGRVEEEA